MFLLSSSESLLSSDVILTLAAVSSRSRSSLSSPSGVNWSPGRRWAGLLVAGPAAGGRAGARARREGDSAPETGGRSAGGAAGAGAAVSLASCPSSCSWPDPVPAGV